jgi:hypothetical protein
LRYTCVSPIKKKKEQGLNNRLFPFISGTVLAGGAVFSYPGRDYVLVGLMLFLPLLDRGWKIPALPAPPPCRGRYSQDIIKK